MGDLGPLYGSNRSKIIAELYPEVTIMFADLAGFTAWSSSRDPEQVFTLLETLYGAFDHVAAKRRVFKVETVGDCYVAAAGVPNPRSDHAVVMCRFAGEIRETMNRLTTELEIVLGPGTANLQVRSGLHSGSVTGGVLRGDNCRFQLFGDTMNTASRMESNGRPNSIQVSQKTADLLIASGKGQWLKKRPDLINAKGKGMIQTYWVEPKGVRTASSNSGTDAEASDSHSHPVYSTKNGAAIHTTEEERLMNWAVSVVEQFFQKVYAFQHTSTLANLTDASDFKNEAVACDDRKSSAYIQRSNRNSTVKDNNDKLPNAVAEQLRTFVSAIARLHRANEFHNFAHACHVTMCTRNLLLSLGTTNEKNSQRKDNEQHLCGLTPEPLAEVAMILASLSIDLEHPGGTIRQPAEESNYQTDPFCIKNEIGQKPHGLFWDLIMEDCYSDMRSFLFRSPKDLQRFRQFFTDAILSTNILDPSFKVAQDERWKLAFSEPGYSCDDNALDMKTSTVLEHLIQASTVCHAFQHWNTYKKWNRKLFREAHTAYDAGRGGEQDPSEWWYENELLFFEKQVIPLVTKLKECGVFGATSQELFDCALENQQEWKLNGSIIVMEMKEEILTDRMNNETSTTTTNMSLQIET